MKILYEDTLCHFMKILYEDTLCHFMKILYEDTLCHFMKILYEDTLCHFMAHLSYKKRDQSFYFFFLLKRERALYRIRPICRAPQHFFQHVWYVIVLISRILIMLSIKDTTHCW